VLTEQAEGWRSLAVFDKDAQIDERAVSRSVQLSKPGEQVEVSRRLRGGRQMIQTIECA
jgi:hypothetical protein